MAFKKKQRKKRVERPGLIKKPKAIQTRFIYEARKYLKPFLQRFFFLVLFFYQNGLLPFDPGLLIGRVGQNPSSGTLGASSVETDRTRRDRAVRGYRGCSPLCICSQAFAGFLRHGSAGI
jgi:hypothetical protein